MPTNSVDQQIRSRIESFVEEISELIRASALDAVRSALGGNAPAAPVAGRRRGRPPGPRTSKAAKTRTRGGKHVRRSSESVQQLAGQIEAAVASGPGRRLGEIAAEIGATSKELSRPAQNLVAEGKVRTTGQRGGTRYFPGGGRGAGGRGAKTAKTAKARRKKATKKRSAKRGRKAAASA